jgi:hypothetical protein
MPALGIRINRMMRIASLAVALALPASAQAEIIKVSGKAGYLSEWEVSANVSAAATGAAREFSGPMTMTHTGLCTVSGPVEKSGEIRYRLSGLFRSRMNATLTIDGAHCTFSGVLSQAYSGVMDCPGTKGVPLTISVK